jgi:molybdate transport system substrate-binding protein
MDCQRRCPLRRSLLGVVVGAALIAALAAACGSSGPGTRAGRAQVRVAAAADLNAALGELIARFSATRAVDVSASYGSSGTFFSQILNGAPFDIFLSADVEYPRQLAERGLTLAGGNFQYAVGRLVLWTPPTPDQGNQKVDVMSLASLTADAVKHVSIANPEHAPYGRAAVAALRSAGAYDAVKPKLVYGENVAQALQFAQSGSADAAIVAMSLVLSPNLKGGGRWVEVPADSYPPLQQGGAILRGVKDVEAAMAFRAFLTGPDGRAALQQYGFGLPEQ